MHVKGNVLSQKYGNKHLFLKRFRNKKINSRGIDIEERTNGVDYYKEGFIETQNDIRYFL